LKKFYTHPPSNINYDRLATDINLAGTQLLDEMGFPQEHVEWTGNTEEQRGLDWNPDHTYIQSAGDGFVILDNTTILDSANITLDTPLFE
jgi:hypothetical protein